MLTRQQAEETAPALTADRGEVRRIAALLKKAPLSLADYHAVGEQMRRLSEDPAVVRWGGGWRDSVAKQAGYSVSTLTKAMQFRNAYRSDELPGLEEMDVGWSRLTIALAVEDKQKRHELLREAKERGWGERELRRAVQQLKGSKRGGGRPRRRMHSQGPLADAAELLRLTELWLEFDRDVWSRARAADPPEMDGQALLNLQRLLELVARRLKDLQAGAKEARQVAEWLLGRQA